MSALKRVVRSGTLEEIRDWILSSRPAGASIVMDARYFILTVPEKGRVAAVGLKRLSWFATELKHLVVKPDERRKGHGRTILRLALERVRTPLVVATVRVDNVHWLRANLEEGFREVEKLGTDEQAVAVLVRRVRARDDATQVPSPPTTSSGNG